VVPSRAQDAPAGTGMSASARRAQTREKHKRSMAMSGAGTRYPPGRPPAEPRTDVERKGRRLTHLRPLWVGLQVLNVSGCTGIFDGDVVSVVIDCEELRELRVSGCVKTSGRLADTLRMTRANFRVFHGAHLEELDDKGITMICRQCPGIEELDITGCPLITDVGLCGVADSLPSLIRLRAGQCSNSVTMGGIMYVASQCRMLRVLEVGAFPSPIAAAVGTATLGGTNTRGRTRTRKNDVQIAPATPLGDPLPVDIPDSTFQGDLGSFVAALGLCMPAIRELDISYRVPTAMPADCIETNTGSDPRPYTPRLEELVGLTPAGECAAAEPVLPYLARLSLRGCTSLTSP